jgi:hypothetical protein
LTPDSLGVFNLPEPVPDSEREAVPWTARRRNSGRVTTAASAEMAAVIAGLTQLDTFTGAKSGQRSSQSR